MTALFFAAALLPGLYWEGGGEAKAAGVERVYGPAGQPLPAGAVTVPSPGVRYRADVASATTVPWVDANGWRYARGAGKLHVCDATLGSAALAAAEAYASAANAVIRIDPKQLAAFAAMLSFLKSIDRPEMPPLANIGFVDDGSAPAGEAMNLLARRNLLFRIVPAPIAALDFNLHPGPEARNPHTFAAAARAQLTDQKRLVRIYGSDVTLAVFTGEGPRARLFLINYGRNQVEGLRVRVLGGYRKAENAGGRLADVALDGGAIEFSVPAIELLAAIDLER